MKRKTSKEKRLSANKSRVTSPSPKKKKWDDSSQEDSSSSQAHLKPAAPAPKIPTQEPRKQRISLTTTSNRPSIPMSRSPRGSEPLP